MARPTKLTPKIARQIVDGLRDGNYADAAARAAGVDPATYYRWLGRGRTEADRIHKAELALEQLPARASKRRRADAAAACKPDPQESRYREFCEAVARASAEAEAGAVRVLRRAADGWEEPCPACDGAGRLQVGHKTTVTGRAAREQTRAEVRTCGACGGRGRIDHLGEWRAAVAFLERRHPDRWRRRTDMVISGDEGRAPVQIVGADASEPAATEAAHDLLRRIAGDRRQ